MKPIGYAIDRNPSGLDTHQPYYRTKPDPLRVPNCLLVLVRFLGGHAQIVNKCGQIVRFRPLIWLRYRNEDVVHCQPLPPTSER